jgi:hypothetical protein
MNPITKKNPFEYLSNKDFIQIIKNKLFLNFEKYFQEFKGLEINIEGKLWGGQETARTFRFKISSVSKEYSYYVFVKLCPIYETVNPAKMEYETLELLYKTMPSFGTRYNVPRPLDYFDDLNAYVMKSVGEFNFKNYLLKRNSRFKPESQIKDLYEIISDCANWLRIFHEITKSKHEVKFNLAQYIESLNEEWAYGSLKRYSFKCDVVKMIDELLQKLPIFDGKINLPCAKWHWDFTPGHVFLDGGKINVIDILGVNDTPIYEDIGRFLASLSTINNLPFYPFFDHDRADNSFCDVFIDAYLSGTNYKKETFLFFSYLYKLKYLIMWFLGQHYRVSTKVHPLIGDVFANLRLVSVFEGPLIKTIDVINRGIGA